MGNGHTLQKQNANHVVELFFQGTKLHFVQAGNINDPFVLLLHGFPDCWLGWHNQVSQYIFLVLL